nr:rhodanese-like domain-containing protein [Geobacteraceae bacterium]
MANTINCKELYQWITEGHDFILIDTLPPEHYESRHIAGARNACVYEIDFLDTIRSFTSDTETCIVLYDSSDRSRAAACAAEKLSAIGFQKVYELSGGIEEWEGTGYPVNVVGPELEEEPVLTNGTHQIDCTGSRFNWTGRNIFKKHFGTITISGGELVVSNGEVTDGYISLDMHTIRNIDLENRDENSLLIRHLKSDDFFDVERFPSARFDL